MGLNTQYLVCFFFFLALLGGQAYSVKQQYTGGKVHPVRVYIYILTVRDPAHLSLDRLIDILLFVLFGMVWWVGLVMIDGGWMVGWMNGWLGVGCVGSRRALRRWWSLVGCVVCCHHLSSWLKCIRFRCSYNSGRCCSICVITANTQMMVSVRRERMLSVKVRRHPIPPFLPHAARLIIEPVLISVSVCVVLSCPVVVCDAAARITLIIMLILLAQGWTIARDEIQHKYAVLGAAGVLSILYFAFIIWDLVGRDTVNTLYVYDGAAGYFIITIITICAFWFAFYIARSYRDEVSSVFVSLAQITHTNHSPSVVVMLCVCGYLPPNQYRTTRLNPRCSYVWAFCISCGFCHYHFWY